MNQKKIIMVGNPNVGKSTLFNLICGKHQHTGNWNGKTVEEAKGYFIYEDYKIECIDLPGIYSLYPKSIDEKNAITQIYNKNYDVCILVCSAMDFKRSISLIYDLKDLDIPLLVVINQMDEAKKHHIWIDIEKLKENIGVPILMLSGYRDDSKILLKKGIVESIKQPIRLRNIEYDLDCINEDSYDNRDWLFDRVLVNRVFGPLVLLGFLFLILWLTIVFVNIPSDILQNIFQYILNGTRAIFESMGMHPFLQGMIIDGMLLVVFDVIAVMLPAMMMFFPLFAILEEWGYLARVAFLLDGIFHKAHTSGKHALTMMMGLGCNVVGVLGCNIIQDKNERIKAMITNSFIPCNGRFPTLIILSTIMMIMMHISIKGMYMSAIYILIGIIISVWVSFIVCKIMNIFMKQSDDLFILELVPYKKIHVKHIVKESIYKIYDVLKKSCMIACLAGGCIYVLGVIEIQNISILQHLCMILEPIGSFLGIDGVIVLAFLLSFPANEIFIPILLMLYMGLSSLHDVPSIMMMQQILMDHGWTLLTICNVFILTFLHFPCTSTFITIKKQLGYKWMVLSIFIPLSCGCILCILNRIFFMILGL